MALAFGKFIFGFLSELKGHISSYISPHTTTYNLKAAPSPHRVYADYQAPIFTQIYHNAVYPPHIPSAPILALLTHSTTYLHSRDSVHPINQLIFGMWKETRSPRKAPHITQWECVNSTQSWIFGLNLRHWSCEAAALLTGPACHPDKMSNSTVWEFLVCNNHILERLNSLNINVPSSLLDTSDHIFFQCQMSLISSTSSADTYGQPTYLLLPSTQ